MTKCLGSNWWTGESVWRALTRSAFNKLDPAFILHWQYALPFIGIAIWLSETAYPFLIWPKQTRPIWLALIISLHLAIGLLLGMYLFALIMIVLNLAAFGAEFLPPGVRTRGRRRNLTAVLSRLSAAF